MLSKFILFGMLSLVSASVEALFFFFGYHTFLGGSSPVAEAMSSEHEERQREERSRSPARVSPTGGKAELTGDEPGEHGEVGNQSAVGEQTGSGPGDRSGLGSFEVKPEENKGPDPVVPTPQEESSGRVLLNTIISASKSLEACATQLEANAGLLEVLRADSPSVNPLAAGVNYDASTTKAAHAAQGAHHKQVANSSPHRSKCTSKAAYHLVETSKGILDELKSQKVIMGEQCELLKTVAANQVELSKLMKAARGHSSVTSKWRLAQSFKRNRLAERVDLHLYQLRALEEALHRMALMALRLLLHQLIYRLSFLHIYQHFLWLDASGLISQLSPRIMNRTKAVRRNPPSAAYVSQDTPGRKAQPIQVVDDSNSMRSVSPTPHTAEQTRSMNASYVPKGWVELQDGSLHRIYGIYG